MNAPTRPRASDHIRSLMCGFAEPTRSKRRLAMLQCFIDDSGMNQPPVYILAGWIAPAETWAKFSDDWAAVLRMAPRIGYFKYAEAMSLQGEFSGISPESRDFKLKTLIGLLEEYRPLGLSAIIPHDLFKSWFGDVERR